MLKFLRRLFMSSQGMSIRILHGREDGNEWTTVTIKQWGFDV